VVDHRIPAARRPPNVERPSHTARPADTERPSHIARSSHGARPSHGARKTAARRRIAIGALTTGALVAAVVATRLDLPTAPLGIAVPGPLVNYGLPIARAATDLASVAMFGFGLVPLLVPGHPRNRERIGLRWSMVANLLLAAAALASLLFETADLTPGRPVTVSSVFAYVGTEQIGQALLATAGAGLLCLAANASCLSKPDRFPTELRLVFAGVTLIPLPLTGHGEDSLYHGFIILSREAHVLAASAWTGGLFALALLVFGRRGDLAVALPRFSRLATIGLCVVGCTGIIDAIVELAGTAGVGITGLWRGPYGLLVLGKLGCLILLALLGGNIRFRLLPGVAAGRRVPLVGWVALELAVMGLAYGLAAVLQQSPLTS
jgi:putative copper resistance protein D